MTIGNIIERVQSDYSRGVESDDSRLYPRYIYSALLSTRSLLFSQKAAKNQVINITNYQTINFVELVQAPITETSHIVNVGSFILKSVNIIPKIIYSMDRPLIEYVSSLDGSTTISNTSFIGSKYKAANKYTGKSVRAIIQNNSYLYVPFATKIDAARISAIFEDPILAYVYDKCYSSCMSYLDYEFPCDETTARALIDMTVTNLIDRFTKAKDDKINDSADE